MSRRQAATVHAPRELPLIETKLSPTPPRPGLVVRDRLLEEIERGPSASLTLVDAPVGFGKTVLVESWCARTESAVAWVSVDGGDNDPTRLLTYVAAALDRVRPGLGRPAMARLRSAGRSPDTAVDELVNAMNAFGEPLALVVDDLHLLTEETCIRSVAQLVEHLPPNARVVATSRSDPPLPLARLRARGALTEIRARQLAFTLEEARELVRRGGVDLGDEDVELLVERTEGWPAGLYLATLWLRAVDDPSAGVAAFHGDHRHVADYLTGEVLDVLDDETRHFLLETSVFGTFSAAMCDEILDRTDSAERLQRLEHSNVFLIPLDARGGWYRYHHLFGELLRLELTSSEPAAPSQLHARACEWCREHRLLEDALEHAAATGEPQLVAEILVAEHVALLRSGRLETLLRWCAWLPREHLVELPLLPLAAALAAGLTGTTAHVRRRFLALAERSRSARPDAWTPYHEAALAHASSVWVERDIGRALALARRAAALGEDTDLAATTKASLGFLLLLHGDADAAGNAVGDALRLPEAPSRPHGVVVALATLSLLTTEAGDLDSAEGHAREALATARAAGVDQTASGGLARVALASALSQQGRLREAEHEAIEGERLRRHPGPEAGHLHALLVLARIRARRGRLDLAVADLARARRRLETFTDAGRLPELAAEVGRLLEKAQATAELVAEMPTAAELSVLKFLATDRSQREIAARLFLSVNTVKTHTRSLYRKLGATSRAEAVERANALHLLDPVADSPG